MKPQQRTSGAMVMSKAPPFRGATVRVHEQLENWRVTRTGCARRQALNCAISLAGR